MCIFKATTKPVSIEAILWTGDNTDSVNEFLDGNGYVKGAYVDIGTNEGGLRVASINDYIVKDTQGNAFPCKPDVFKATYDY